MRDGLPSVHSRPGELFMSFPPHDRAVSTNPLTSPWKAATWKHRFMLLATGMGVFAIVLFSSRNLVAQAETSDTSLPSQRLPRRDRAPQPQTVLWVNPQTGNDARANGSEQAPFRTLTQALEKAQPNTVIQLASGTYSTETGEVFPIVLKAGVTVQGNPDGRGSGIVIRGGGSYSSPTLGRQNTTLLGNSQATLIGVTITNPTVRGHGLWVEAGNPTIRNNTFTNSSQTGLVVTGSSAPIVERNLFMLNRISGLNVTGDARPAVQNNIFQRTGSGLVISEEASPQILNNRVSQNRDGIVIQGNARPLLRGNTVEDSDRDGLVVIAQAQPNLGTAEDPGNNVFLNNRQHDIDALATTQTLPAFGNQLTNTQLTGKVDLSGKAPWIGVATIASTANHLPLTQTVRSTATNPIGQSSIAQPSRPPRNTAISANSAVRPSTLISSLPPTASTATRSASTPITTPPPARGIPAVARTTETKLASARSPIEIPVPAPETSSSRTSGRNPSPQAAVEISVPPPERPTATRATGSAALQPRSNPARASVPAQVSRAIEIPVPPPEQASRSSFGTPVGPVAANSTPLSTEPATNVIVTAAASLPRQSFAANTVAPRLGGSPINIPVPPPDRPKATSASPSSNNTATRSTSSDARILPVPAAPIPLGNTGDIARISVSNSTSSGVLTSRANLQYRVVVAAEDEQTQALVQSIAPGAFTTVVDGRSVIQVGAFSNRDNAEEAIAMLSRNGFQGIIQPME